MANGTDNAENSPYSHSFHDLFLEDEIRENKQDADIRKAGHQGAKGVVVHLGVVSIHMRVIMERDILFTLGQRTIFCS